MTEEEVVFLKRNVLRRGYCPHCTDSVKESPRLVGQQELDGDDHSGNCFYVMYWNCPMCGCTESELASSLGMEYKMCKQCYGYGTTGYDEWEENCDQCDGIGYTLSEPAQMA